MPVINIEHEKQYEKSTKTSIKKNKHVFLKEMVRNRQLYLLTLPAIVFFIVFSYLPLGGLVIAFQDFNFVKGILGSEFVGLKNFEFLFTSGDVFKITFNTIFLNLLFIITGTISSILLALMFSEVTNKWFAKISQGVAILPHFLSWTVVAMIATALLTTDTGFVNIMLTKLGLEPISFYTEAKYWPLILVMMKIWQAAGFSSIVYTAVIAGMDPSMYEAAKIDGATRLQQIRYITLPLLKPTIVLLTLFAVGKIFYGDFGMIYALVGDNSLLFPTTDVIDTFVYRALRQLGDMGMSTAVGLYQSIVGFFLVVISNYIAKKIDEDSGIF
jgi:putative aldouronate transport system permease protein